MRFPIHGGRVRLPEGHPQVEDGCFPAMALLELAAQAAGHAVVAELGAAADGHAGMLVEVESATVLRPRVPVGEVVAVEARLERVMGPLRRYRVRIDGVLDVALTLRVGA